MTVEIDEFDRRLIALLVKDGRQSNLDLARQLPLSHSAISRRIKRLEESGVIQGYAARVDRTALGETVRAFSGIARQPDVPAVELAGRLAAVEGIASCWIISGDADVMVEVVARDMAHFRAIMLDQVQNVPGVAATRSIFILSTIKEP